MAGVGQEGCCAAATRAAVSPASAMSRSTISRAGTTFRIRSIPSPATGPDWTAADALSYRYGNMRRFR
jgi:hypothetical protein